MSIIGDVFGAGGIADLAKTIIQKFGPEDPAAKQAALDAIDKNKIAIQQMQTDYDVQLNSIAGQNIRAEATSDDKFTSRARPSFAYLILAVLGFNYIGIPVAQIFGSHVTPIEFPSNLLELFGVYMTGYVFNRTAEKIAAMPGDSSTNFLGIIRASNKSPQ